LGGGKGETWDIELFPLNGGPDPHLLYGNEGGERVRGKG